MQDEVMRKLLELQQGSNKAAVGLLNFQPLNLYSLNTLFY